MADNRLYESAYAALRARKFDAALKAKRVSDVILCGMETQVCVSQTCLDMLNQGFRVFVVADAVSIVNSFNNNPAFTYALNVVSKSM